jgi:hypothetical protein
LHLAFPWFFVFPVTESDIPSEVLGQVLNGLTAEDVYIEYGSGGSTIEAAEREAFVVAVESSLVWARSVNKALVKSGIAQEQASVIYCSLGPTVGWGYPIDVAPTARNLSRWRNYVRRPWKDIENRKVRGVRVLVDGRFRMACVAFSFYYSLKHCINSKVILDDFEGRAEYIQLLDYCDVSERVGRAAVLEVKRGVKSETLLEASEKFLMCHG